MTSRAVVEVVADASKLGASVQRSIDTALAGVNTTKTTTALKSVSASIHDIGVSAAATEGELDQFWDSMLAGADDLLVIETVAGGAFESIAADARESAAQTAIAFQTGIGAADTALESLDRSASEQFSQVRNRARQTAATIASSIVGALATIKASAVTDLTLVGEQFSSLGNKAEVAGAKMAASSGALLKTGAVTGVAALAAGLGALTITGLKSASSIEQISIGLESLLGSSAEATKFLGEIQKFAAQTPFEFGDVADASRRILAFGNSVGIARDNVIPTLTVIGDLVSVLGGTADNAQSVIRALGQIASKGKLSQEEILQLAEALPGFNANAAIASNLGLSVSDTLAKITAGGVDASTGIHALLDGMAKFPGAAGAMEKQSHTLAGVFSNFQDTVSQALAGAFEPAIPAIKASLIQITPLIGDTLKTLAPALGGILSALLKAAGPLIQILAALLTPLLAALGPAIESLTPSLTALIPSMTQLAITLAPIIPLLANFLIAVLELAVPLLNLLIPVLKLLTPLFQFLADAVGEFAKWLATIDWGKVGHAIGGAFTDAWHAVSDFFAGIGRWFAGIGDWFAGAGQAIGDFVSGIGRWFADLPGKIGSFLASLPGILVHAIGAMFDAGLQAIGVGLALLYLAVTKGPGLIMDGLLALPGLIADFFTNLWKSARDMAVQGFLTLVALAVALPGQIMNALVSLGTMLGDLITKAVDSARDAFVNGWNNIVDFVKSIPDRLAALGPQMASAGGSLIKGFFSGLSRAGEFVGDLAGKIVDSIKGFLNHVIGQINIGIAKVDDKLPGVELPRIPTLATGGLTTSAGLAALHPTELVLPLESARTIDLLSKAIADASTQRRSLAALSNVDDAGAPMLVAHVYVGDREITDIVKVEVEQQFGDFGDDLARGPRAA